MNLDEFNRIVSEMKLETNQLDAEKKLATRQLMKDYNNEEMRLKIKKIQKELDEKDEERQRLEEIQREIEKILREYPSAYDRRRVQITPYMCTWKVTVPAFSGGKDPFPIYNEYLLNNKE